MKKSLLAQIIFFILLLATAHAQAIGLEEADLEFEKQDALDGRLRLEEKLREAANKASPKSQAEWAWRLARSSLALGDLKKKEADKKKYYQTCIDEAERALTLDPREGGGYLFRGICRGKLGELKGLWASLSVVEAVKEDMESAVKYRPAEFHGGAHRALGKLYHRLPGFMGGSYDKAIGHFRKAIKYAPAYADNHLFLAESYYASDEYRQAYQSLQTVLELAPADSAHPGKKNARRKAGDLLKKVAEQIDD